MVKVIKVNVGTCTDVETRSCTWKKTEKKKKNPRTPARKREDLDPKCFATFEPPDLWNSSQTSGKEHF